jgi:anti-sigma28 factor (negative regulator of flagellin synthesis)
VLGSQHKREPSAKVKAIKDAIKSGTYDMAKAIEGAADRIVDYPQCLLQK